MSMTKKQARKFKARLDQGEFPPLPKEVAGVLRMQPDYIIKSIHFARRHEYGNGPLHFARRLVQMGLFDRQFNLTNYGDSYVNQEKNVEQTYK